MDKNRSAIIAFVAAVIGFVIVLAIAIAASDDGGDLDGTTWVVETVEVDGQVTLPVEGTTVTAAFEDGQVNGSAGCNTYFGEYELDGDSISIGPLASTQIFCEQPEGAMEQEIGYLTLLGTAESMSIDGDRLTIEAAGDRRIVYTRG